MKAMNETRASAIVTALAVWLLVCSLQTTQAQTWNVINETYGNGAGELSFNASYTYAFGSTAPTETLSAGKATLNLPQGIGARYPVKAATLPAWAGGGADVTLEWKIALRGGSSAYLYLAENQKTTSSTWGHILSFDRDYNTGYQANEIEDYYARNGTSLAPAGFDSSQPHVYRLVRRSGVDSWYLDGQLLKQALVTGPGAAADGCRLEWGFNQSTNSASYVDVYYFRAANGAFLPLTWNVMNEVYGNGPGEVSFNASYSYLFGSVAPTETLSAGKAALTIPQGSSGVVYPYKAANLPAWSADTDVTIEWKMAFSQGGSGLVYFSQTESTSSSTWGGIEMFDLVYGSSSSVYTPNAIADYFRRVNGENLAPAGFNSSVPHTYRFVRQGGTNSLYVDNNLTPLISPLVNGPGGAAADGYRWGWGFYKNAASDSEVDIYYLKAAHGAFPPDGSTTGPVTLNYARNGGQLILSWDTADYVLQETSSLGTPACWLNVTNGATSPVVVTLDAAMKFYRLADRSVASTAFLNVGSGKQLFIDNLFFESSTNVALKVHPPQKTGEKNLQREQPWESATLNWFNVMQEGSLYRMWYECYDIDGWPTADDTSFCYAESTDGINWTRPNLGMFTYQGSTNNNILFRQIGPPGANSRVHGTGVFIDPTAPSASRYKALSQGIFSALTPIYQIAGMYSADGLHWTRYGTPICPVFADSQDSGFWDVRLQKYVIYGRVGSPTGRSLGRSESTNFSTFPALNLVLATDSNDPTNSDLYNSVAMQYPYATNAYFMFPSLYQHTPDTLDIRLAVSRDGVTWTWPERIPFIPLGATNEFDSGSLYMGQGSIRSGDELWLYYSGSPLKHQEGELDQLILPGNGRVFSRVVSRLDGFVSADAPADGGSFVTPPLVFSGNSLKLNVQVRPGGTVRVGLMDSCGIPVPGRAIEDCVPIAGDGVALLVQWNTGPDVSGRAGKPTKMRVEMQNASVYAFQFDN
jgi:hypothetical protein